MVNGDYPLKVLLILKEFPTWRTARPWSYTVHFGIEEGFQSLGIQVRTILSPWLPYLSRLCHNERYDQVWVEAVHTPWTPPLLEHLSTIAPIRIALVGESLEYDAHGCIVNPIFAKRKKLVMDRLRYFTHALFVDEWDAMQASDHLASSWWPQAIPRSHVTRQQIVPVSGPASFSGAVYGKRKEWLRDQNLRGVLKRQRSAEKGTVYPFAFNLLQLSNKVGQKASFGNTRIESPYTDLSRHIRRQTFECWLRTLRNSSAVVNLPGLVRAYAGRVVESMAVGCPVISWTIPNRPKTLALFRDGEEILLFDGERPDHLVEQVRRLQGDPSLAMQIATCAKEKISKLHTMEIRLAQFLRWISCGQLPDFNEP